MRLQAIKTPKITPRLYTLESLLDRVIVQLQEGDIVAISSKIVSLCEGRVVPVDGTDREMLIKQEADYYLPTSLSRYGHHFTIKNHTIIGSAGIDESNGDGFYVLWPENAQATANHIRRYLRQRFSLERIGVVIVDSVSTPMRLGALGAALAFSGFVGTHSYVGQVDLFGRPIRVERADIAGGLAAAAVLVMGEGAEQTPLAIMSDTAAVTFVDHDPTPAELATLRLSLEDDLFAPFLAGAPWEQGEGGKTTKLERS